MSKHIMILQLVVFWSAVSMAATDGSRLACQSKIDAIESQGISRGALAYALKHVDPKEKPPRYILLAQMGKTRAGELFVVDTQTGRVTKIPMQSGLPENQPGAEKLRPEMRTAFGVMKLNPSVSAEEWNMGLKTQPVTAAMKAKLAAREGYPELVQAIAYCPKFGKRQQARQMYHANDFCIDQDKYTELAASLQEDGRAGSSAPLVFAYPKDGVAAFAAANKPLFEGADVCKALGTIAAPGALSTQPPVGGSNGTEPAVQ